MTFKLTNTGTEQRFFEVDFLIEKTDGTYHEQHRTLLDRYLSPGESLDWDSVVVKGDDNPPDANCDIQILDPPFEVFDQQPPLYCASRPNGLARLSGRDRAAGYPAPSEPPPDLMCRGGW